MEPLTHVLWGNASCVTDPQQQSFEPHEEYPITFVRPVTYVLFVSR